MKTRLLALLSALCAVGCATKDPTPPPGSVPPEGCEHDAKLPPLELSAADKAILASRSNPPKTAADYYFSLPSGYSSVMEHTPERRATFIEKRTLSDSYLHAERWIDCDGGGFDVTIRVFDGREGPLVAISSSTYNRHTLYFQPRPDPGHLNDITVRCPRFWRYSNGNWTEVDDVILPMIAADYVIDRYRNHYKAHRNCPDQHKSIWLAYDLPATGNEIAVSGRENFMDPLKTYVWKRYVFDGTRFREK